MRGRRLISQSHIDGWERRLRVATDRALSDQLAPARRHLALVAAGDARKVGAAALMGTGVYGLWNSATWSRFVTLYVGPEATDIEVEAAATAIASVPSGMAWGFVTSGVMSSGIVAAAIAAGAYLGERLDSAGQGDDPSSAVQDVLATAGAIVGGLVGAMASQLAQSVVAELGSFAASNGQASTATKQWNAVGDDRTREAHMDADGQEVSVDDTFDVMGEDLMYPGDPQGSDENVMGCRCWLTMIGLDSGGESGDVEAEAA